MNGGFQVQGFDWDDGNRPKCRKHGVARPEIEAVFRRDLRTLPDRTGSSEPRFNAVGTNDQGRFVFVVFTIRSRAGGLFIRPISARYMHAKEIEAYDDTKG